MRFTGIPFFSGIGDVTVFNIGTGETTRMPFDSGKNSFQDDEDDTTTTTGTTGTTTGTSGNINCNLNAIALTIGTGRTVPGFNQAVNASHLLIVDCVSAGQVAVGAIITDANTPDPCPAGVGNFINQPGFYALPQGSRIWAPCAPILGRNPLPLIVPAETVLFIRN